MRCKKLDGKEEAQGKGKEGLKSLFAPYTCYSFQLRIGSVNADEWYVGQLVVGAGNDACDYGIDVWKVRMRLRKEGRREREGGDSGEQGKKRKKEVCKDGIVRGGGGEGGETQDQFRQVDRFDNALASRFRVRLVRTGLLRRSRRGWKRGGEVTGGSLGELQDEGLHKDVLVRGEEHRSRRPDTLEGTTAACPTMKSTRR